MQKFETNRDEKDLTVGSKGRVKMKSLEEEISLFFQRVNDAFIASQTISELVNDSEYQRLLIKNGRAKGLPLGNRHLLPGFWYTVFVAPYESFHRVLNVLNTLEQSELTEEKRSTKELAAKFINKTIKHPLRESVEAFRIKMEYLISNITWLEKVSDDSFPDNRPLRRFAAAISNGNYQFFDSEDLICVFEDSDFLCGYTFKATVNVAEFNQLAIDFTKELVFHLKAFVEHNKTMRKEMSKLLIGEVFLNDRFD